MKQKLIFKALFISALIWASGVQAATKVDEAAPDFTLIDSNGESVTLSAFKGKHVVLEWTNDGCPYVGKFYNSGTMQEMQAAYAAEDTVWLTIISSAPGKQGHVNGEEANELTASRDASPSHVLFDGDGKVGKMYGAQTTPHMYIIDPDGVLRYNGAIDSIRSADPADIAKATNYVDAGFTALGADQELDPKTTRPYGCSVKY